MFTVFKNASIFSFYRIICSTIKMSWKLIFSSVMAPLCFLFSVTHTSIVQVTCKKPTLTMIKAYYHLRNKMVDNILLSEVCTANKMLCACFPQEQLSHTSNNKCVLKCTTAVPSGPLAHAHSEISAVKSPSKLRNLPSILTCMYTW